MTTATARRAPPAPSDIAERRKLAGLSQSEAAALIHSTENAWVKWEKPAGDQNHRRMHPAFFELFERKTAARIKRRQAEGGAA